MKEKSDKNGDQEDEYTPAYIREFLEKHPIIRRAQILKDNVAHITGKSTHTIDIWLKQYRDGPLKGVICRKHGKNVFYYAEKHKDFIEKKYHTKLGITID